MEGDVCRVCMQWWVHTELPHNSEVLQSFLASFQLRKTMLKVRELGMRTGRRITFTSSFSVYLTRMKWENSSSPSTLTAFPIYVCNFKVGSLRIAIFHKNQMLHLLCTHFLCTCGLFRAHSLYIMLCALPELLEGLCYQTWVLHWCRRLVHGWRDPQEDLLSPGDPAWGRREASTHWVTAAARQGPLPAFPIATREDSSVTDTR